MMYTLVNPNFTINKDGLMGSTVHIHFSMMCSHIVEAGFTHNGDHRFGCTRKLFQINMQRISSQLFEKNALFVALV